MTGADIVTYIRIWATIDVEKGILDKRYKPTVGVNLTEEEKIKKGPKFKRFFDA